MSVNAKEVIDILEALVPGNATLLIEGPGCRILMLQIAQKTGLERTEWFEGTPATLLSKRELIQILLGAARVGSTLILKTRHEGSNKRLLTWVDTWVGHLSGGFNGHFELKGPAHLWPSRNRVRWSKGEILPTAQDKSPRLFPARRRKPAPEPPKSIEPVVICPKCWERGTG